MAKHNLDVQHKNYHTKFTNMKISRFTVLDAYCYHSREYNICCTEGQYSNHKVVDKKRRQLTIAVVVHERASVHKANSVYYPKQQRKANMSAMCSNRAPY